MVIICTYDGGAGVGVGVAVGVVIGLGPAGGVGRGVGTGPAGHPGPMPRALLQMVPALANKRPTINARRRIVL